MKLRCFICGSFLVQSVLRWLIEARDDGTGPHSNEHHRQGLYTGLQGKTWCSKENVEIKSSDDEMTDGDGF